MAAPARNTHDLHELPRVRDGWTFLYADKVRIERCDAAIELVDEKGRVQVPVAALSVLLLGPGASAAPFL
jgi:CRISPR-associated protein Cas1